MKILYIYCHPLPESFHAAIRVEALAGLKAAGHEVDLFDLYAEKFDPVLSEEGRRHYHDEPGNRAGLEPIVARLQSAEAIVAQFPTWCFGPPAMAAKNSATSIVLRSLKPIWWPGATQK